MNLFSVDINSTNDVLKIDDTRCLSHFNTVWIILIIALVMIYFAPFLLSGTFGILLRGLILMGALIFIAVRSMNLPYRNIYIFDKNQKTYRFIECSLVKTQENSGKLDEIKKINIEVTEYQDNNSYNKYYKYQPALVLDDFLSYDNSHLLTIGEESGNYQTSRNIAFSIADFLQLKKPEEPITDDYSVIEDYNIFRNEK